MNKKIITLFTLITSTAALTCGCGGSTDMIPETTSRDTAPQETASQSATSQDTSTQEMTSEGTSGHSSDTQSGVTQDAEHQPASAESIPSDGHGYVISNVIDQRTTPFGDMGCGGAAGLMALQALGLQTDKDTDEEYAAFWSTVPGSSDSTKGWNSSSGIWNPAYTNWLGEYTFTERMTDITVEDIKQRLSDGQIVIPLVSLGDTGTATHWFTVYGWYEQEGVTLFKVADPWAGGLREYTGKRLQERIDEGARRKGLFGVGSESDGVALWK